MLNEQAIDFNYLQRIICFDGQICMVANDIKKQQENKGLTSLYVIIAKLWTKSIPNQLM